LDGRSEHWRREPLPAAAFVVAGSRAGRLAGLRCEVGFADYLHAERAAGLVRIIDADCGEEQVSEDAGRQEQAGVDADAVTRGVWYPRVPGAAPSRSSVPAASTPNRSNP
jgi:hypothetical protein